MRNPNPRPVARCLAAAVLFLAAIVTGAAARDGATPSQDGASAFGDVVDVQLVNVEVWVTDRKGNPISGLTAADFEVLEDGEPVAVSYFSELGGASLETRAKGDEIALLEEQAGSEPSPSPAEPAVARQEERQEPGHMVIYFDELRLSLSSRKRVVADVGQFLESGQLAAERILILRQDDNLYIEAPFGSSAEEIAQAMVNLAQPKARSTLESKEKDLVAKQLLDEWDIARQASAGDPCLQYVPSSLASIDNYASRSQGLITSTIDKLAEISTFLAGIDGVKTLVYIGDSLELSPGSDLKRFVDAICPLRNYGYSSVLKPLTLGNPLNNLTRHANANRVTFYTLQSSGLRSDSVYGADRGHGNQVAAMRILDRERRLNERDGLVFLAKETGGRAVINRGHFQGELENITRDMSAYYSLAYTPLHGGDGREHKIKVRVGVAKTKVRHRMSYLDKSSDERMTENVQSALYLGEVRNPLAARLGAGEVRANGKAGFTVPLHILVPIDKIVFLPQDGVEVARLRLQIATRDYKNGDVSFQGKVFRATRPSVEQEHLDFVLDLELEGGNYDVAVGLRDEASRETSYVRTALGINESGDGP
jgi:VWFA-related protein